MAASYPNPDVNDLLASVNELSQLLFEHPMHTLVQMLLANARAMSDDDSNCTDFDGPICFVWWSTLQCDSNPAYMNQHCRLSCGQCTTLADNSAEDFSFLGFLAAPPKSSPRPRSHVSL